METNNNALIQEWLDVIESSFKTSIDKLHIGVTGTLRNSIIHNIIKSSDGNVGTIELKFKFYGRFIDMGVGRGVPVGSRKTKADFLDFRNDKGQLHFYNRKRKNWYSTNKTREIHRLRELLAEQFGKNIIYNFENKLGNTDASIEL